MQNVNSVLVLLGGNSPEREISIKSGTSVVRALNKRGYKVHVYDPIENLALIKEKANDYDIVLPILHGVGGEDGTIQELLEEAGARYLGSDSEACKNSFNKIKTHQILEKNGILMPKYAVVELKNLNHKLFQKPFVLKPIKGGSSIDTIISRKPLDEKTLIKVKKLFNKHNKLLLEELINGLEITVPILGEDSLPAIAIIPPEKEEFDYKNKYNGATKELCPIPQRLLSKNKQKEAQLLAKKVHSYLEARHLSRTDMIIDNKGNIYVLELNTIPGMTDQSLYPNSAAVFGLEMPELMNEFIKLVKEGE